MTKHDSTEKIDFVIPWVDGGDPEWRAEKAAYTFKAGQDARDIRFRDWDLLRYWFRGIEKFAPWVNKIHFITWGHLPPWLDIENPKIHIVYHKDYIPKEYLPTFSSHVIELNMHRIEGLSEQFVYFNDDVFLIDEVLPEDFFQNGLPCDCLVESAITPRIGELGSILCATTGIINKHFSKKDIRKLGMSKWFSLKYRNLLVRTLSVMPYHHIMGFYNPHLCTAFKKQTLLDVWEAEPEVLHETCMHRFRGQNDVNQYVFRYWNLCKGTFVPQYPIGRLYNVQDHVTQICDMLEKRSIRAIAINDKDCGEDVELVQAKIKNAFEKVLGVKSGFEMDEPVGKR